MSTIVRSQTSTPSYRRVMAFIDGENLAFNFQTMLKSTSLVKNKDVIHREDVFVWHPFTILLHKHEILRASYYTFCVGDENKVSLIRSEIKSLKFEIDNYSQLPNNITPVVFKKDKQERKTKGVDIKLTVDILTNVFNNNLDTVLLVTGDGDFLPIIQEAQRNGKQVFLAAFKTGLNEKLLNYVDMFIDLDNIYFQSPEVLPH